MSLSLRENAERKGLRIKWDYENGRGRDLKRMARERTAGNRTRCASGV
ncbi:hypothetical protein MYX76_12075 [Desulfobacterota bacterium AH_259_B03_O07]|nr:hypothetical protein [Desulfobacterota bacterium AH_259_B03_O07]